VRQAAKEVLGGNTTFLQQMRRKQRRQQRAGAVAGAGVLLGLYDSDAEDQDELSDSEEYASSDEGSIDSLQLLRVSSDAGQHGRAGETAARNTKPEIPRACKAKADGRELWRMQMQSIL
jgi:hypothetical protein